MITERVGRMTVKYPWLAIGIVLLITFGSLGAMFFKPMETSFNNEDFLPDMEVSRTNTLYSETFTSSYSFVALIRSDGDLVTPESFTEMIELSDSIVNSTVYEQWKDTGSHDHYPLSPASAMFGMYTSYIGGTEILELGDVLRSDLSYNVTLKESITLFSDVLHNTSVSDSGTIISIVDGLASSIDPIMNGEDVPVFEPVNMTPGEYYGSFNNATGMKEDLGTMFSFSFAGQEMDNATGSMMNYSMEFPAIIGKAQGSISTIDTFLDNGSIDNTSRIALEDMKDDLQELIGRISSLLGLIGQKGDPVALGNMAQGFYGGQYILSNFLTKDFDPMSGSFRAEGAMLLVSLDNSLFDLQENDLDGLLEIEQALIDVVEEKNKASELSIHSIANAQVGERITEASNDSMKILLPLAMVFVFVILLIIYRSIFDMVLNLVALVFAIIWMYGFGSLMGYSSNPMITAVPVLLVGLGIDYGIHLTMRYREEIRKGKKVKEALTAMSASVGMALLLATFTTVFAFLSNIASPVKLILQFGVMAAVGITASFLIMLLFIPSVKSLVDVWKAGRKMNLFTGIKEGECDLCEKEKANKRPVNRVILGLTLRAEKHPVIILTIIGLITAGMFGAAINSEVTFDVNDFLPDGLQESRDINYLLSEFAIGGSGESGIIIVQGDIADPDVLAAMDSSMDKAMELGSPYILVEGERPKADFILYAMSDTYSQFFMAQPDSGFINAYNSTFDPATGLPYNGSTRNDVSTVLGHFLDEFPSNARKVIHREEGEFTMAAIAFTIYTEDDSEAWELYDDLREIDDPIEEMEGKGVEDVSVTGSSILMAVIIESINQSQITSLVLTIIVSFVVLTIIFFLEERSLLLGGVAVLPVIFCVIWIAGTMYIVGIPLNVMTITIGALTVGLGITYGIHITHRFVEDVKGEEDLLEASKNTIMNTGSALFGAALTTVAGFGLLSFAKMPPLQQFGQVTALAIIYSFLSSVIVLPVLLIIWAKGRRKFRQRKLGKDQ